MKRFVVAVAALAAAFTGCAGDEAGPTGPGVEIAVAPLDLADFGYFKYRMTVTGPDGSDIWTQDVDSDAFGAPNGSVLFVGPCNSGTDGSAQNTVTVEILEIKETATSALPDGLVLPPAESLAFTCLENQDVRVQFEFTIARQSEEGFVDILVDIEDIFCSAKVSCEPDLMPDPVTGDRGPTLVTGFSCTGGDDTTAAENYVGFEAMLCCDAPAGDDTCTNLAIDPDTGGIIWSAFGTGVVDTSNFVGEELADGKVFHNTSWLLDPSTFTEGCEFYGFGFVNSDPGGEPSFAYNGNDTDDGIGASPAFHFRASIRATDGLCQTGVDSSVTVDYDGSLVPPEAPAEP